MGTFATDYDWLEGAGSRSPVQITIAQDGSSVTAPYLWEPTDAASFRDEFEEAIAEVLGGVEAAGDGSLHRDLPAASDHLQWCFANRIQGITGEGTTTLVTNDEEFEAPTLTGALAVYDWYRWMIHFTTVPFAVLSDTAIDLGELTYYNETGASSTETYASEWLRFTDYDYSPGLEVCFAQHGAMKFRVSGGGIPNGKTAPGFPKITASKMTVRFRWYGIPFDTYLDGTVSHLIDHVGKINQSAWYGFPAGSLLLAGVSVSQRYPPPVPERVLWTGSTSFSASKLATIELLLEYTGRTAQTAATAPTNSNWIAAGWNLNPYLGASTGGTGYYYSTRVPSPDSDSTKWKPTFDSFPFQLLFTDPGIF